MNTIEDRIKAATRAIADTVPPDGVPPLRLPDRVLNGAGLARWTRGAGWNRWSRWLAPAAAAIAVIAVAVTLVVVRAAMRAGDDNAGTTGLNGPSGPGPGLGAVPPYFVAIAANGNPSFVPTYAVVRATRGGSLLGTVKPSLPGYSVLAVTGAGDDRTFVLDEATSSNGTVGTGTRSFYLLRLKPSGAPASVTKLPMTAGHLVTGVALSPDGARLAIAVQPQDSARDADLTDLRVYTLATGAVRIWSENNGVIGGSEDDAASISWTADGRFLAFDWGGNGSQQGAWLLDTTRGGSGLLADSHQVMSTYTPVPTPPPPSHGTISSSLPTIAPAAGASLGLLPSTTPAAPVQKPPPVRELTCQGDEVVTPDGSAIICPASANFNESRSENGLRRDVETGFLEYSVATGKVVRILGHWVIRDAGVLSMNALWSNPSGTIIVGAIPDHGDGEVGVISGNTITPLHIPGDLNPAFAGVW